MKKLSGIKGIFYALVIFVFAENLQTANCQPQGNKPTPIPENINKIFQTFCMRCHGIDGRLLAKEKLDFSKWAEYGAENEPKKAANICYKVSEGEMPPKSVRKTNPELIPTKEQIELICKWADSYLLKEGVK